LGKLVIILFNISLGKISISVTYFVSLWELLDITSVRVAHRHIHGHDDTIVHIFGIKEKNQDENGYAWQGACSILGRYVEILAEMYDPNLTHLFECHCILIW
jgi:hypothetical protein